MEDKFQMNMELSVSEVADYFKHLPDYKCPICGGKTFSISTWDGKNAEVFAPQEIKFEDSKIKKSSGIALHGMYIQSVCQQCAHVSQHNYWRLYLNIHNGRYPDGSEQ